MTKFAVPTDLKHASTIRTSIKHAAERQSALTTKAMNDTALAERYAFSSVLAVLLEANSDGSYQNAILRAVVNLKKHGVPLWILNMLLKLYTNDDATIIHHAR